MQELRISANQAGQRLDKYLQKVFSEAGKGFLYKMMRKKNIVLNGKKCEGPEVLKEGDTVSVYFSEETFRTFSGSKEENAQEKYPEGKLAICFENRDILAVAKPAGMLSQKAEAGDVSLNEYMIGYLLRKGDVTEEDLRHFHPSVCNRLDRNTSGLVLCGKTMKGLQFLSRVLKDRTVSKYYLALVQGKVTEKCREKAWLCKDEAANQVQISGTKKEGWLPIETEYEPVSHGENTTLLKVLLLTGRSHQIRAYLAYKGHPVVGDRKYRLGTESRPRAARQLLHAYQVVFPEPLPDEPDLSGLTVCAPLPSDFRRVLREEKIEVESWQ